MKHGDLAGAWLAFRAALKQRPDAYDYAWLADALDRLHKPEEAAAMRQRRFDVNVAEQPTTVVPSHPEASTSGTFLMHKKRLLLLRSRR